MKQLVIWGAGGHGRVVLDIAMAMSRFDGIAFLDDDPSRAGRVCGYPVLPSLDEVAYAGAADNAALVVAIGSNQTRARCAAIAAGRGWELATLIHPSAIVSPSAR